MTNLSPGARITWLAALVLLATLTLVALWYPVQRISQYADINYNEGWNTYRADMAAHGTPLFSQPPAFTVTNYPPLSFHLIGFLGRFMGGSNAAGRWVSLVSLILLAIAIAMLVQQFTNEWRMGIYAALLFSMALAVFVPERIGMNDPQLAGLVLSFAGLAIYARNPRSNRLLCISAGLFALSLFIKHNLLAFPAAVVLHLLFERAWKHLATWLAAAAATSVVLLALTYWWDGRYFLAHLLAPRSYSFMSVGGRVLPYLLEFQILIAAAALWSVGYAAWSNLLAIAFVLAHIFGIGFAGGYGVVENVLFDALIMIVVITAIALSQMQSKLIPLRFGNVLLLLALTLPWLGVVSLLPGVLLASRSARQERTNLDADFHKAVEFVESHPGPALCEDLLLCYDAGKPPLYDAFYVNSQMKIGRLSEADVRNFIESSHFSTIEISIPAEQPLVPMETFRFSEPVMRAILERYRPVVRTREHALLIPKDEQTH